MANCAYPAIPEIRQAFVDEVSNLGGTVSDVFEEGQTLFVRSTFPHTEDVQPKDAINRGTALRANEREVMIHPYIFRQMCRNGAIMAQVTDTCRIERLDFAASQESIDEVLEDVRVTTRASSDRQVFQSTAEAMRSSLEKPADIDMLISIAAMLPDTAMQREFVRLVMSEFIQGQDHSQFGVINAVTAVARETRDPATRWRLEELGGSVLATLLPDPTPLDSVVSTYC
jgi:hypothetical protein